MTFGPHRMYLHSDWQDMGAKMRKSKEGFYNSVAKFLLSKHLFKLPTQMTWEKFQLSNSINKLLIYWSPLSSIFKQTMVWLWQFLVLQGLSYGTSEKSTRHKFLWSTLNKPVGLELGKSLRKKTQVQGPYPGFSPSISYDVPWAKGGSGSGPWPKGVNSWNLQHCLAEKLWTTKITVFS